MKETPLLNSSDSSDKSQYKDKNLGALKPVFDFQSFINPELIKEEADKLLNQNNEVNISENLKTILTSSEKLKQLKSKEIKFSEPVLRQGENAVIFPNTINVIQGQAGVHKSRLAEIICSAFLKLHSCKNELLGFTRTNFDAMHTVVYVDTERNQSEQLPYALQSIQIKAGYNRGDHPHNFEYISLLEISRKERFQVLEEYLSYIKKKTTNSLFIVLDVSTDCIEDFNKTDKSMELIDLMNIAINKHNVIFLCLIHENPKSDKARGHFGTELMNKASTVMQLGYEKDGNQNDTDIIRVKYLKCRSTARHTPFYFKYSQGANGLVLANQSDITELVNSRKHKANSDDLVEFIELYLGDGTSMTRRNLLNMLCKEFNTKERTIENRLKEILNSDIEFINNEGESCRLSKETCEKEVLYKLIIKIPF